MEIPNELMQMRHAREVALPSQAVDSAKRRT